MGLLDDAIREHLELKRLRGADANEVTHEEREARGHVLRADAAPPVAHGRGSGEIATAHVGRSIGVHSDPGLSQLSQETMELDMQAVLGAGSMESGDSWSHTKSPVSSAAPYSAMAPSASQGGWSGEPIEWEVPGERERGFDGGRQEELVPMHRLTDNRKASAGEALAEVPDSLHDAPGQERR
jgi:hypothetical protein